VAEKLSIRSLNSHTARHLITANYATANQRRWRNENNGEDSFDFGPWSDFRGIFIQHAFSGSPTSRVSTAGIVQVCDFCGLGFHRNP
jgi:hypothetical protein